MPQTVGVHGSTATLLPHTPKAKSKPLPQDDPRQRQPDIDPARDWLGWEPTVPLDEGLTRTIEYFRERLDAA